MTVDFAVNGRGAEKIRTDDGLSTVMGIKGANGSGKTNVVKALGFLSRFCAYSYEWSKDEKIPLSSWYKNNDPVEFEIEFKLGKKKYKYELVISCDRVISEVFYDVTNKRRKIVERESDGFQYVARGYEELKKVKLKSNSSIFCLIESFSFENEMSALKDGRLFFVCIFTNVDDDGYLDIDRMLFSSGKDYFEDKKLFSFVVDIVRKADSGICDAEIKAIKDANGDVQYIPVFKHNIDGEVRELYLKDESSGTRSLFQRMRYYYLVLKSGGILALDEFDIHLHAKILPGLIRLFENEESNPHGAQFIFTAHNTEIIDSLGKYRTILVNKEGGESYGYRLDEIPGTMIRNDRTIVPLYLQGKIGGVPDEWEV